jgi:ubiquinone/menaquinone biosynthesis C-methylase UbiE
MSTYENYSETSKSYDKTRVPIGVEIILGCLARAPIPLARTKLLDAGCGTGAYSQALLPHVAHIDAVDINPGMLEIASKKLSTPRTEGLIQFHRAAIDELPFADASFDAITVNQVLHHLPDSDAAGYPAYHRVLKEFSRLLRSDGRVMINTCSHTQLRDGFWPYALLPEAVERICKKHVPLDELERLLEEYGFSSVARYVPVDAVIQGEAYFNARGPLDKHWRDGDSLWAMATESELQAALAKIRKLDQQGKLEQFVERQDQLRRNIGQVTFVCASRR